MDISNSVCLIFVLTLYAQEVLTGERGKLNDPCQHVDDCDNYGYFCDRSRTCQCRKFYIPKNGTNNCVGGVNQLCKYDEHCIDGAFCKEQKICKCKDEYFVDEDGLVCASSKSRRTEGIEIYLVPLLLYLAVG